MKKADLDEIKTWLDHGDQARIADKLKIKRETVCQALSGKTKNHRVLIIALDMAIKRKTEIQEKIKRLKNL